MRNLWAFLFFLFAAFPANARDCYTPTYLDGLSSSAVYSVCQDKFGAVWLNTSTGVFRHNGNALEIVHSPLIMRQFAAGDNYIYALMSKSLLRFDVNEVKYSHIPFPGSPSFLRSSLTTKGDSLYVSVGCEIYLWDGESVNPVIAFDSDVTSILSSGNNLFVATDEGTLHMYSPDGDVCSVADFRSYVTSLYRCPDASILVGLYEGGFLLLSPNDFSVIAQGGSDLTEIRTISTSPDGVIFVGAVNGVFEFSPDLSSLSELTLGGNSGLPVCSVFTDRDSNLWVGTFYNGVFFSDPFSLFSKISLPSEIRAIKSICEDSSERLWIVTDGFGIYCSAKGSGRWECIPSSRGHKFQGSYYDEPTESIWMGEYRGGVFRYDIRRKKMIHYDLPIPESIASIVRKDDNLLMAGMEAVFSFNPSIEETVTRRIFDLDGNNTSVSFDKEGHVIIAGNGLKVSASDSLKTLIPRGLCSDVFVCDDNSMWVTVIGKGLARISASREVTWLDTPSALLSQSSVSSVRLIDNDCLLLGSRKGIFLFRPSDCSVMAYSRLNGLDSSIASVKSFIRRADGSVLVSGFNGLSSLEFNSDAFVTSRPELAIDNFFVNGVSARDRLNGDEIILAPGESNFSFNLADYEYSHVRDVAMRWNMSGFDSEWHKVKPGENIDFMNMRHGRYVLNLESMSGNQTSVLSIPVVVKPFWYQTVLARLIFILLALAVTLALLYTAWSRAVLAEKLHLREKENNDRIRFFQELSLELRTPLNLVVGQLEKFFQDFGARTHGIEDLESVYRKTRRMQNLISDFVDEQNEKSGSDVVGANFLNAATGVVERHLFSGDLDVAVLCSELNMGKTKLSEQMRRCCGKSPREFIEDIRLKHADEMLREGHHRVSEVSDRLGFSSPRYFLQRYKAKFGHAPTKDR